MCAKYGTKVQQIFELHKFIYVKIDTLCKNAKKCKFIAYAFAYVIFFL